MTPLFLIILFFVGACFGSFANVIIYRWPKGESIIFPGSHCVACGKSVAWFHNIPIISYFVLRGRCAHCQAKFSARYALVELLCACLFLTAGLVIGWQWYLLEVCIFIFGCVVITFIDIDHFLIPDIISIPGLAIGLAGAYLNPERHFFDAITGALLGGGALWTVASVYYMVRKEEGMGGGDIKLLAWIGAVCGWKSIVFIVMAASLVGTVGGLLAAFRSKKGMKTVIPFGPYLVLGSVLWIFGCQTIGITYLKFFFPFSEISN